MRLTQDYFDARRAAIKWLKSNKPFIQGVQILQKSGYKPVLVNKLLRRGENPSNRQKLEYEIRIMIKMWNKPDDPIYEDADIEEGSETVSHEKAKSILDEAEDLNKAEDDEQLYPKVVQKVIYNFSECYKQRDILQKELAELGENNTDDVIAQRKEKVELIKSLSDKIDKLDALYDAYKENGTIPTEEQLNEALTVKPVDKPEEKEASDKEPDLTDMTIEELKKLLKNEQTKMTRAKNQLLYQQNTVPEDKKENPMPDCPEKVKYTRKVEKLTVWIEKIKYRIAEIG